MPLSLAWSLGLLSLGFLLVVAVLYEGAGLWQLHQALRAAKPLRSVRRFGVAAWLQQSYQQLHKKSEHQRDRLLRLLRQLRRMGRAMPDALVVFDAELRIQWLNRNAESLLGLKRSDRGADLLKTFAEPAVQQWLRQADGPMLFGVQAPQQVDAKLSLRKAELKHESLVGLRLLMARDVSAWVASEQIRRDFVANVSHELRTPLTVLRGYLESIDAEDLPEYAPIFEQMQRQTQRMVRIVEDLLTLARLENEATGTTVADQRIGMSLMLQHLVEDAKALSQNANPITLNASACVDLLGDEKDLRSVFANLLSNAVRYTPPGGLITVSFEAHAEGAAFSVRDCGIGIPQQHLHRLTERFYRVSASRSRDSGGTGLGLAIVNHVLMQHQARLEIESEVGRGSCFRCVFPKARLIELNRAF
jgi:two-component system, OmpR family, phosphate regulon sensor histidine kinase PhoR